MQATPLMPVGSLVCQGVGIASQGERRAIAAVTQNDTIDIGAANTDTTGRATHCLTYSRG